ncbi:hypothetical protein BpHYR1_009010 [Brachionus plicatilis]|uniref:Uncharacterized protein n=1 Tax=Brachionus plicatilis TaxID=10195 RepID=A0A3M7QDG3_BRAPC|nr:hypothetical protein BpHYR1_009010 [Brachionus plicatilis]
MLIFKLSLVSQYDWLKIRQEKKLSLNSFSHLRNQNTKGPLNKIKNFDIIPNIHFKNNISNGLKLRIIK